VTVAEIYKRALGGEFPIDELTDEQYAQRRCDRSNAVVGDLEGYDCPLCLNRGYITRVAGRVELVTAECSCMEIRRSMTRMSISGLGEVMGRLTFERFRAEQPWQQSMLEKGRAYAASPSGWFVVCGQSGCGKTHICTATAGQLLRQGRSVRYVLWRELSARLKAAMNQPEYEQLMTPLKKCDVLYIDDLFKGRRGEEVTDSDIKLAFELLNARYIREAPTIISTERTLNDLFNADEAIGGRIYEMSGGSAGYCLEIKHDRTNNYRLRKKR